MEVGSLKHRLGWIGLGRMGYAMVERLAMAKADVRGYNRTGAKAEPLVEAGVGLVDNPSDLADCDIVFTMVSAADDLKSVAFGEGGLFSSPGRSPPVLVELSTISVEASAEIRTCGCARAISRAEISTCISGSRAAPTISSRVPATGSGRSRSKARSFSMELLHSM